MDILRLTVICSSVSTISIILVYIYLYILYREKFMGFWALCWLILLSRYLLFDTRLLPWKHSLIGLTIYQLLIYISCLMFVWSTHISVSKPFKKPWLYATVTCFIISSSLNLMDFSLEYKLFFPVCFGGLICIWTGLIFIRYFKLRGYGHIITGYSFILWGLINMIMPFILGGSWFLPWAFAIGGILRLNIAIGTLMVYLEKSRADLIIKETKYRLLTENAVDIIYYYQFVPEAKIGYISPSVLDVTGYAPEDYYADNKLIFSLVHLDDRPVLDKFISNLPGSMKLPLTLRLVRKNNILWMEQKCIPLFNEEGKLIAVEGIVRDITMRINLEKMTSLIDRMNMVGNMAATVAHEIRNPMTTVHGYLQKLKSKNSYQDDKDKFELMIEELDRANSIITEYLSLSRERVVNVKSCSLNSIIELLFPLIQADANSSNVFIDLQLAGVPNLLLDENELRQLLLNLVRNGIESMSQGGTLTVRTFEQDNQVVLAISDQGKGIPPRVLENLGTPFITTKDAGTGLGLPMCYQIARRHNAELKFATGPEGTTVSVHFSI